MDPNYEEEVLAEEETISSLRSFNPVTFGAYVLQFLASYGWYLVGAGALSLYAGSHLRRYYERWRQAREDALYHKDERLLEGELKARQRQQEKLLAASQLHLQREAERRAAAAEKRAQLLAGKSAGNVLGSGDDSKDYLPLSGGASASSYRAPKRSGCPGGSCGR